MLGFKIKILWGNYFSAFFVNTFWWTFSVTPPLILAGKAAIFWIKAHFHFGCHRTTSPSKFFFQTFNMEGPEGKELIKQLSWLIKQDEEHFKTQLEQAVSPFIVCFREHSWEHISLVEIITFPSMFLIISTLTLNYRVSVAATSPVPKQPIWY